MQDNLQRVGRCFESAGQLVLMDFLSQIAAMPKHEQAELLELLEQYERAKELDGAREKFLPYVKFMWPGFVEGSHHRIIADLFDDVLSGRKNRVIINMPPRHTKSEFASIYLPSFFLGKYPDKKIIQASHTSELAVGFGRKVRNLIDRKDFQMLFPNISLAADSKAAGRWATSKGGEYFAIGVGGAVAGKGADLFVIDDPVSEQEAMLGEGNPEVYRRVLEWYETGPRQRLQPGAAVIIVMTRWSLLDLTGQLIKKQIALKDDERGDRWDVVELPAILPSGKPIWPEYWKLESLLDTKASIPVSRWNAQYQQQPTSEEGALIKREYWREWGDRPEPKYTNIIQSWDTAFSANTRANYSACTTWGVFFNAELNRNCLMLIDAVRGKWEFPQLKEEALKLYKERKPDICLVEARAAGMPLIYELRAMGIPIQDVVVGRGGKGQSNDKISRVNSITDIFASGVVFARKQALTTQDVIEECAAFPAGENDDYVDTVTQAVSRFRHGGWIGSTKDFEDEEEFIPQVMEYY